jgi:hypothetical protein
LACCARIQTTTATAARISRTMMMIAVVMVDLR